jgi:sugar/nucleoside kinase (ribokinase family)
MLNIDVDKLITVLANKIFTVLPDFFLDIIIDPNMSYKNLMIEIDKTYERNGGNILGPFINLVAGGNGGNVAQTLAILGALTYFVSESSPLGRNLIEFWFHPFGINTNISITGSLASTLVLELPKKNQNSNVMINSSGSVANYSPDKLTSCQWKILKKSTCIAITNIQNNFFELLVRSILEEISSSIFVSIDFSDLTPHRKRIPNIREKILSCSPRLPSLISGNEIEMICLNENPNLTPSKATKKLSFDFSEILFGLHTSDRAEIWKDGEMLSSQPTYNVDVLRATGAGDTWHAGFLFGLQGGLSYSDALKLANAVAGYKISCNKYGTLTEIVNWMKLQ